jgi:polysaccharide deacetylase family protein (PEP-CTERM system associated)
LQNGVQSFQFIEMPGTAAGRSANTTHFFTVDVEEYFHVNAFESVVSRNDWGRWPQRLDRSIPVLLERLAHYGARGTFFTLGWVARENPAIVRQIVDAGHELASHGFWHRRVVTNTPDEFRDDVRSAKQMLEDAGGVPVVGYRAPSFSIIPGYEWAFDVLLEEGYTYDSSVFPIRRSGYGNPTAPRIPYVIRRPSGSLVEFPLATTSVFGYRLPAAGGGYLRQFPYAVIHRAFREADETGIGGTFYIHPWEIDPDQPRVPVSWLTRIRHYRGLDTSLSRIDRLLSAFEFRSMGPHTGAVLTGAPAHDTAASG